MGPAPRDRLGQVVTLTGMLRGDVYHSDENYLTTRRAIANPAGRGVALGALDVQWPFVAKPSAARRCSPSRAIRRHPANQNLAIPNEDARTIDLEEPRRAQSLPAAGRGRRAGHLRIRLVLRIPDWELKTNVGQSYRLDSDRDILPVGTGLSNVLRFRRPDRGPQDFLRFTHRFRLDKDNLAIRRNEIDATVGSSKTYAELGYVRLDRDITDVEDLQDREELRGAVRISFANYWSLFGSGVFNLTNREEDPTLESDGFDPIRTRLGVAYQDDCLELGVTWRRDYITSGDADAATPSSSISA